MTWGDPRTRVALVLVVAAVLVGVFLLWDLPSAWQYVLPLRAKKLATLAVVATAIAVSTVLFQTVTGNRILTPGIMGFDALYILIQTLTVFFFGAATLGALDSTLKWVVEVAIMVLFWASPIVYSFDMVHDVLKGNWLEQLYLVNPMTLIIIAFQKALWLAGDSPDRVWPEFLVLRLVIAALLSILFLWFCQRIFARLEGNFAQEL